MDAPPPSPDRRFIELADPDGSTRWRLDAGFLTSGFRCIWGEGCQGIHDEPRPELMDGCCSVGVVLADEEEAMNITALAATLAADSFQYAAEARADGALVRQGARWATRVVDGACIFLNRPGFAHGAGCALHLGALAFGDEPRDWKPRTCNRVPLRVEERRLDPEQEPDGVSLEVTVRPWRRDDWGPDGASIAWWCVEEPESFIDPVPLHERLDADLRDLLGPELLDEFRDRLEPG